MKSKSSRGGPADARVSCRWSISWFLKPACLAFLLAFTAARVFAQPERVILLRHGEKPLDDNKNSLSPRGQQRAKALVSFFTQTPGLLDQGAKPVLFATHFGRKVHDNHTHETLAPLAQGLQGGAGG